MVFQSVKDLTDAVKPAATLMTDRLSITRPEGLPADTIDRLAQTAVFGSDPEVRGSARWVIRSLGAGNSVRPASIHDLYMALGRGEAGEFTVPAINVWAMAYDTARAVIPF